MDIQVLNLHDLVSFSLLSIAQDWTYMCTLCDLGAAAFRGAATPAHVER